MIYKSLCVREKEKGGRWSEREKGEKEIERDVVNCLLMNHCGTCSCVLTHVCLPALAYTYDRENADSERVQK